MEKEKAIDAIKQAILEASEDKAKLAISGAIEIGVTPAIILENGITGAMQTVGEKWNAKEFWLPDVMAAADTVKKSIGFLKPHMVSGEAESVGTVVIGTVKGDVHNVGKNLVATFLGASGFDVHDLGEDVPADEFIKAVLEYDADVVGMSCFATNVTPIMVEINEKLKDAGVRDKIFTMIGGIAMGPEWAPKVGADAYAKDAYQAAEAALEFMTKKRALV